MASIDSLFEAASGDLYKLMASVAAAVVVLLVLFPSLRIQSLLRRRPPAQQDRTTISACKNPDCVRCQRYRQVQKQAKTRLSWILRDMQAQDPQAIFNMHTRVIDAVKRGLYTNANPWQNPTVLMVDDLPSQEIVSKFHQAACKYLCHNPTRERVLRALDCETISVPWTVNDSPKGHWEVLQILNQGTWNPVLLEAERNDIQSWKELLDHVRNIPGLMDSCLFGNAMLSSIFPGTDIEPHFGPTNVRHRLQFVIEVPTGSSRTSRSGRRDNLPSLNVGPKETISWNEENDVFVFDDSMVHSVTYPKQKDDEADHDANNQRTVLIVDLWHPDLAPIERSLLQQLYPPFATTSGNTTVG